MAARYDSNPFDEDNVNPFANPGTVPPASNSRLSPFPPESFDFYNDRATAVDVPLDSSKDLKKKEKKLQAKEAELNRREQVF
ncbi:Secretory carrier-associated membrane protein 2 [Apostasia shenzhenica]|uniref:Secretory carrier-associated membrane protein 2 n=1 Tax=Apostasia shenzhenica TaxID=1088818 RepID=A0A2H9ZXB6_9ASPA|nr:Secretory carrier-associated membrane protein 2 [Apostasia shenzhenica]